VLDDARLQQLGGLLADRFRSDGGLTIRRVRPFLKE
jgi:hypothetical protein